MNVLGSEFNISLGAIAPIAAMIIIGVMARGRARMLGIGGAALMLLTTVVQRPGPHSLLPHNCEDRQRGARSDWARRPAESDPDRTHMHRRGRRHSECARTSDAEICRSSLRESAGWSIRAAELLVRAKGELSMGVGVENSDARRLYERLGFLPTQEFTETTYSYVDDHDVRHTATESSELLTKTWRVRR